MKPILFHVLGEPVAAYLTFLLLGFVVVTTLARRDAERLGLPGDRVVDWCLALLVLGVLGARLLSVLTDGMLMDFVHLCTDPTQVPAIDALHTSCTTHADCGYDYLCDVARSACYPPRDCLAALEFWNGGLTYYGGVLVAGPAGLYLARRWKLGALRMADLIAPLLMVGLFFGRLGCFFNGCCYGAPTSGVFGVTFPPSHTRPNVPLHPTQLYEAAAVLVIAAALRWIIRPRARGDGEVAGWLLVLYGVWRVGVETLRADPRGAFGPLSTSQLISIPLIALGAWLVWRVRTRALSSPP